MSFKESWVTFSYYVPGEEGSIRQGFSAYYDTAGDVSDWEKRRPLYNIADLLAFEDHGEFLYVAGDATRALAFSRLRRRMFRRYSSSGEGSGGFAFGSTVWISGNFAEHFLHSWTSAGFTELQMGQRTASMNPSNAAPQLPHFSASGSVLAPQSLQ